jgi:hypothetical protein
VQHNLTQEQLLLLLLAPAPLSSALPLLQRAPQQHLLMFLPPVTLQPTLAVQKAALHLHPHRLCCC